MHPKDQIIGNKNDLPKTISSFRNEHSMMKLFSMIEPNNVYEDLKDDGWIVAMQDELHQFKKIMYGT